MSIAIRPPFQILLEDGPCLAVLKPSGLLTEGPADIPSLVRQVKAWLALRHRKPGNVYLGIPHRLDRASSGIVLFARNSKAARRLSEQFAERSVRKTYLAIVEGQTPDTATWQDWIRKIDESASAEATEPDAEGAKRAKLTLRTISRTESESLVEIEPETGRMHQIRVQFATRGHAIRGDHLYGSTRDLVLPRPDDPREIPIALHHRSIRFQHPIRCEAVRITAPVPESWRVPGLPDLPPEDQAAC